MKCHFAFFQSHVKKLATCDADNMNQVEFQNSECTIPAQYCLLSIAIKMKKMVTKGTFSAFSKVVLAMKCRSQKNTRNTHCWPSIT